MQRGVENPFSVVTHASAIRRGIMAQTPQAV
jgi:hypothetical protein